MVKLEEINMLAEGDHEQLGLHHHFLESEIIKHDMPDNPAMDLKADMFKGCFYQPWQSIQRQCRSGLIKGRKRFQCPLLRNTQWSGSMMNKYFMLMITAKFAGFRILNQQSPMQREMVPHR